MRRKLVLLPALLLGAWLLAAPPVCAQSLKTPEALRRAGMASKRLSRYSDALRFFDQARKLARAAHDLKGEAQALADQALVENDQDHKDRAQADNRQALSLFQSAGDADGQAGVLSSEGDVEFSQSHFTEALRFYAEAEQIFRQAGDRAGQANAVSSQGNVSLSLGDFARAMIDFGKALPVLRQVRDQYSVAKALNNLGSAYQNLGHYDLAVSRCRKALPLFQTLNPDGYGKTLINLGNISLAAGRSAAAVRYYQQSLPVFRQVGDRYGEGIALTNIGDVYYLSRQYGRASAYFQQALILTQIAGDQEGRGDALDNLRQVCAARHQNGRAIFYGKQAVNVYQSIRADLQSLPKGTQKIYLGRHEDTYRETADLLIRVGRLPEAQEVLGLLKQQELFEFLRGGSPPAGSDRQAGLTPQEADQEKAYTQIAGQVIALGQQQQVLRDKAVLGTLTPGEQAQMDGIRAKLTLATRHLNRFYAQEVAAFQSPTPANETLQARLQAVRNTRDIQDTLRQLHAQGQDVVVLETVVAPDRYAVIITTAQGQKVEQFPIKAEDLNKKVAVFQTALRDPGADPCGPAHELYKILVAPLEQDLQQAGAKTLMWSLDGTLRYVPVAALYDGKQYLVERFNNAVFTLGSQSGFGADERAKWEGLGMGVSLEHSYVDPVSKQQYHFDPLQSVPAELQAVILSADSKAGVVPGDMLLDPQFTQSTMTTALEHGKYNLVHIASHFALRPGDPDGSFLLLGDGGHLSLTQMADETTLFQGIDLLSLSACDTATGGAAGADGKEVDSLGSVAQQDGAKSILASLWPVSDDSTRLLMQGFYREHETHAGMTKAESLRQSQLSLLRGTAAHSAGMAKPGLAKRGITYADRDMSLPAYIPNPDAPYAHPFYWAPFILIGNWR